MVVRVDLQPCRATVFDENEFEVVLLFSLTGLTLSLYQLLLLGEAFATSFG